MCIKISSTVQEFEGVRYYLCGVYFQRKGVRLHRLVWERAHGMSVPAGYDVHHIDGDRSNNNPENLKLMPRGVHRGLHAVQRTDEESRRRIGIAQKYAAEWHGSDEGRAWHREHYAMFAHALHRKHVLCCSFCGRAYEGEKGKFCSNACKSAARRAGGKDNIARICVVCGADFVANKYSSARTCSRACGAKLRILE